VQLSKERIYGSEYFGSGYIRAFCSSSCCHTADGKKQTKIVKTKKQMLHGIMQAKSL
jgi:hypothetical protein